MMKSPPVKVIYLVSLWIAVLACLDLGAIPFLKDRPLETILNKIGLGALFTPLHYLVGLAGIILLIGLLMTKGGWESSCE